MAAGVLGSGVVTHLSHPFFVLLRNLSLSRSLERIEALVTALWVLPDFAALGLLLLLARREGAAALRRPLPAMVCAAALLAGAACFPASVFALQRWSEQIVPAVNAAVFVFVPALDAVSGRKTDCQPRADTV